ncbi:MAG: P-loop NTPase, partial [Desulfobacterales bacterium]|nr:P-loop NTPase [Desulfobacterales bacterium]
MILKRRERFIKVKQAYETLVPYIFKEEKIWPASDLRKSSIVAVGGAKGGIGKSMFSTNLGIYLSSLGKTTVLVDLDLGGANLHLYLGEWS